ncbi:MAG: DUF4139 domain-containing protein [Treponema sp.]|jgi:hypothetical protein|nr:DUF4139 domain-containing protein [Treponema sp.]
MSIEKKEGTFRHTARMFFFGLMAFCLGGAGISAQALRDNSGGAAAALPVTRISLFSSGLAFYEHSGMLNGRTVITLPFKLNSINDALKSLVLSDPASSNPSVSYQSEQTLVETLRSLKIDLSDEPDMAGILGRLRGAEVEVSAPSPVSGRITGVEYRHQAVTGPGAINNEPWLSLYTAQGLKLFNLKEINTINFKDPAINEDLTRALDIIAASRNSDSRNLSVMLPGSGSREVSLSYVLPAPVWKVSYRLDLGALRYPAAPGEENSDAMTSMYKDEAETEPVYAAASDGMALFQGWVIVDNDSDTDWVDVELSLVAGKPSSFIQDLYHPYYQYRPTLPLAIAGTAAPAAHDRGYGMPAPPAPSAGMRSAVPQGKLYAEADGAVNGYNQSVVSGGTIEGTAASAVGDQFEFTVKRPVTLNRRMSTMLPLGEGRPSARKLLIFSGFNAADRNLHPRLGVEIVNTTGMSLPAGPITVYDDGTYAGDALIEFWNQNETRLISYGEDLSVTGTIMDTSTRSLIAVSISGGVLTVSRSQDFLKAYSLTSTSAHSKHVVIEHPKTQGAVLESPPADEQTSSAYRFTVTLAAGRELMLMVRESRPVSERISLLPLKPEAILSFISNSEIPPRIRTALQQAVDLRRAATAAETAVSDAETRRTNLVSEQDRIRKNLEAAGGGQTQQGQEYLKRLTALDNQIDALAVEQAKLQANVRAAQKAYEDYLNGLNL